MEDKDLQQLFQSFSPELPSDTFFMRALEANLQKVEFIRRQQAVARRQNRRAVVVAAATGFVAGVVFILIMPYITSFIAAASSQIPALLLSLASLSDILTVLSWSVVGIVTAGLSLSSYQLAMTLQTSVTSK